MNQKNQNAILPLLFEIDMLAQDWIVFLDLNPLGRIALVLDRMIDIRAFCASELNVNSLFAFFLCHC